MRCHLRIQQIHLIFIIWKYDAQQNLTPQTHDPGFPLDLSDSYSVSIPTYAQWVPVPHKKKKVETLQL